MVAGEEGAGEGLNGWRGMGGAGFQVGNGCGMRGTAYGIWSMATGQCCTGTDMSCVCDEHDKAHRLVKSLCRTPETPVTLRVSYISSFKKKNE